MKKAYSYNVMSERKCIRPGCKRHIKKRLAEKPGNTIKYCYRDWTQMESDRGHLMKGGT